MTLSIALVDNDEAILDSVKLMLESKGWCVRTYATGEEFLADVARYWTDCVIMEPQLPGMSGAEVARSMAKSNGHIPFIGLTSWPVGAVTLEVAKEAAFVMLTKPVSSEELVDNIRGAVGCFS